MSCISSFCAEPNIVNSGEDFNIRIETVNASSSTWRIHHPYTIPAHGTLPGFEFDEKTSQAYYKSDASISDKGILQITINTSGWPSGIHNFTLDIGEDEEISSGKTVEYRDFAIKAKSPQDELQITVEPDRYFGEGTHFNTFFVLSNNRIICGDKYSDDKGYTWTEYSDSSLQWGSAHAQAAIMAHEFSDGHAIGLAYRTLPREGEKGVFIGKLYETKDGGKSIHGPYESVFYVPRAVGSQGHAFHPGPLFMRSIVEARDSSLLALMCGWFDTDTKESPVKGQNYRRSFICRSSDRGLSWEYYSTIAYEPNWGSEGWNEGSLRCLPDGNLIAALRSGSNSSAWKDNPLCLFFSEDGGLTWSPPHRSGIDGVYPGLVSMSNGILACSYGRPGAKIMFSVDNGMTWTDHTSINGERYSGYSWIVEVEPNELLYGFGVRNGLDPETGERRDMLRITNIHVNR